jgi:hypothetical protein
MMTFMEAIARQEGFYATVPDLPNRRNNPGDIEDGPWAQAHGALPSDGSRFAKFANVDDGFAAMRALLLAHYLGLTVLQAIQKWEPVVENDDSAYVRNVCAWTGLTPSTVLTAELIG